MDVKPKIDQKQLNDLRKNHWPIGGPTASILETTSSKNLRPGTAVERDLARPKVDKVLLENLCSSHWAYHGGNPVDK
jgi:hypothetical protein